MAIKFEKIVAGMRLWERRRARWRSSFGKWDTWPVDVVSVDPVARTAVVRWNGNPEEVYGVRSLESLHVRQYPKERAATKETP